MLLALKYGRRGPGEATQRMLKSALHPRAQLVTTDLVSWS